MQVDWLLLAVIILIGWLITAVIRSRTRRASARRPDAAQTHPQGGLGPAAPSPAGDVRRRPTLTVAAEVAGILGLFVALIALLVTH
jgi:hypothetical protein